MTVPSPTELPSDHWEGYIETVSREISLFSLTTRTVISYEAFSNTLSDGRVGGKVGL